MDEYLIKIKDLDFSYGGRAIYKKFEAWIFPRKNHGYFRAVGNRKNDFTKINRSAAYPERGEVLFDGINVHRLKRVELCMS